LELRHRPSIPSSLGQNRSSDQNSIGLYPSKRHSTPAFEKQKRTTTMNLIISTAVNRALKQQ